VVAVSSPYWRVHAPGALRPPFVKQPSLEGLKIGFEVAPAQIGATL